MENQFDNTERVDNPNVPDVDLRKKQQGKMLAIVAAAAVLLIGGVIIINMNLGKKNKTEENNLSQLTPLEADEKQQLEQRKYSNDGNYKNTSEDYADGINDLSGSQRTYGRTSNENLNENDFKKLENQIYSSPATSSPTNKQNLNRQNQAEINRIQREISYHSNPSTPLYQKSREEIIAERQAEEEREFQRKSTERILSQMEKAMEYQNNPNANRSQTNNTDLGGISLNQKNRTKSNVSNELELLTNENSIGTRTTTGFYTESKTGNSNNIDLGASFSAVPAVIHGKGDGITVQNGSTVTLRLLADTQLKVGGMPTIIRKNTLISGVVSIGNDRVLINVSSLRFGNNLIPVNMTAYDIDGVQGLYIPNLSDKNMVAQELGQTATRPFNGSIFSTGSVGNQVATQLAVESSRGILQGAGNMLRQKLTNTKVTIKPNYKVLLKSSDIANTNRTNDISNY